MMSSWLSRTNLPTTVKDQDLVEHHVMHKKDETNESLRIVYFFSSYLFTILMVGGNWAEPWGNLHHLQTFVEPSNVQSEGKKRLNRSLERK